MKQLRKTIRSILLENARDEDNMLDMLLSNPEGMKTALDLMEMSGMIDNPWIMGKYDGSCEVGFVCSPALKKKLAERLTVHQAWDGRRTWDKNSREYRKETKIGPLSDGTIKVGMSFGLEWVEYDRFGVRTQNY